MYYDKTEPEKFLRKIYKRIGEYFAHKYGIDDFSLSGVTFVTDFDVDSRESVSAYLKVLRRVDKVKGFTPVAYDCFEDIASSCWEGNSNGISFSLYSLEDLCRIQLSEKESIVRKDRGIMEGLEDILRAEVRLMKPKAIRSYTDKVEAGSQITNLMRKRKDIFLDTFAKIVAFGDFYKKDKATEIICKEIGDGRLRRRMLRLVTLIPEKKSLNLAQKAMECRSLEKIMRMLAKINVSLVTISKRQDVRQLRNVYEYFV
ncbi:MAG: hypothetical protein K2K90_02130 [Lachnospiraceae bacterium]|nr:hypothetical protein [Lachnospiraceae bacterium]